VTTIYKLICMVKSLYCRAMLPDKPHEQVLIVSMMLQAQKRKSTVCKPGAARTDGYPCSPRTGRYPR
jgi:hypothetical protein